MRAVLVATPLVVLTLAGHAVGAGAIDVFGTSVVVVLSVALALALTAITRTTLRGPVVLGTLLAGQVFLHFVLTFASDHAHADLAVPVTPGLMVAGHGAAAVVATILVMSLDDLLRRWCRFLSAVLGTNPVSLPTPTTRADLAPALNTARPSTALLRYGVVRRGPPASFALAA